jgi:hypothetical protein
MRRRSTRSYVVELVVVVVAIAAIYLFITNGGPSWFGQWLADYMGAP